MSKRKTTEEFISEAKLVHGNKYDYSKVEYINSSTKVIIVCKDHGEFHQKPTNQLQGKGCPSCANEKLSKERILSQDQVIQKCISVHGDKYTYKLEDYKNYHSKIDISCSIHGVFKQTLGAHINGKQGCPICANSTRGKTLSTNEFIEKGIKIHGDTYSYNNTVYTAWCNKVTITCQVHGDFKQSVGEHLSGCGCPKCAKHGFNIAKPAYLYYLKITTDTNQVLYKIGITNRTVNERFNLTDLAKIEIVKQKLYDNGQDALDWETKLKRMYKEYQYKGPDILSSGNTELFTEDIITMFAEYSQ